MQMLLVIALVFASFVAVFALQNAQTVPIRFFSWERETSVAVIALAAAAVGALSATLAGMMRQLALAFRNRQLKAELVRVQRELDERETTLPGKEHRRSVRDEEKSDRPGHSASGGEVSRPEGDVGAETPGSADSPSETNPPQGAI